MTAWSACMSPYPVHWYGDETRPPMQRAGVLCGVRFFIGKGAGESQRTAGGVPGAFVRRPSSLLGLPTGPASCWAYDLTARSRPRIEVDSGCRSAYMPPV